jgi:hypothetical protein
MNDNFSDLLNIARDVDIEDDLFNRGSPEG